MEDLLLQIQNLATNAPWILFPIMLLGGFNIPVSEDGMLFVAGVVAASNPEKMWSLFLAVYLGAYGADLICYGLGRFLGPKFFKIKLFANMVPPERLAKISGFYEKYGIWTLIFGRFIPFGARNGLFLTAGLSKMNALKFALSDLVAATISCGVYFTLYYKYGESVIASIKQFNLVIFAVAIIFVVSIVIKKKRLRRKNV
ncbi:MAG: alkaline phosphatase [Bdellovibrionales bacterium CG12_big_fil_rev_8_21_14_0_65_38_15]|nr:MAG: alkaline phosphatase [Bdellovibrionales bacterium CG22_combo_CG10-13_8_21_14_all_38_13]PIQ52763.1 MAG: alkaline phosphatase [Bdellovibrionales bacterium CG12_big_fil_rev_8_21_14_0_65_38_15]PIR28982.1 MAG: alkaline phosphatase [Bdellovibrionales bacterium CG11_big_fil_rev_8_21_14_0_20_38_13]